jgi:hypothetical protein
MNNKTINIKMLWKRYPLYRNQSITKLLYKISPNLDYSTPTFSINLMIKTNTNAKEYLNYGIRLTVRLLR